MLQLIYPFSAIVGQDDMKLALLLNAINPAIGGILIEGEKGTAKSTAVRALVDILPPMSIEGNSMSMGGNLISIEENPMCIDRNLMNISGEAMKVVDLPLNATEDRVVGTLDLEVAIRDGKKRFEPGILYKAHGNILYVDEVNLLDDHIIDILLDVAAMGVNTVEREGISYSHPAKFILIGTMNPEEGDLRPQLLDRFGLSIVVKGEQDPTRRLEIIKRRLAFEQDPTSFWEAYRGETEALHTAIIKARQELEHIVVDDVVLYKIASLSIMIGVDGHRPDITMMQTAQAHAAWQGRKIIVNDDLRVAAHLALPHRMRRMPFEEQGQDKDRINEALIVVLGE